MLSLSDPAVKQRMCGQRKSPHACRCDGSSTANTMMSSRVMSVTGLPSPTVQLALASPPWRVKNRHTFFLAPPLIVPAADPQFSPPGGFHTPPFLSVASQQQPAHYLRRGGHS